MDTSLVEYKSENDFMLNLQRFIYASFILVLLFKFMNVDTPVDTPIPVEEVEEVEEEKLTPSIDDRLNDIISQKAILEKHYANEILNYIDNLGENIDALIEDVDVLKAKTRQYRRRN